MKRIFSGIIVIIALLSIVALLNADALGISNKRAVACQEDALNFAYYESGSLPFKGWSPPHDIGDKTGWRTNDSLFFVKGKVLVFIQVNPSSLGRDFVRSVAESIEKKL